MFFADHLDALAPLPGAHSVLTITEPGPVGIFDPPLTSIQEIQTLLRAGSPLSPSTLAGSIASSTVSYWT